MTFYATYMLRRAVHVSIPDSSLAISPVASIMQYAILRSVLS